MIRGVKGSLLAAVSLALVGCAASGGGDVASAGDKPAEKPVKFNKDPYPSTYKGYPTRLTVVKGVTIFDGEGGRIDNGSIVMTSGKVDRIGGPDMDLPTDADVIDGTGKFLTPGVIDIHSHLGDYPSPSVEAHSDGNEATSPTTPEVWSEHSVWPQDPGFSRALANGGVTSLQILPGSANLMGGRSITLKNVPSRTVQGMKFPGAPYGLKMACGENPKRVYGGKGRAPSTRMGNFAVNRATWQKAAAYKKKMDDGKAVDRDLAMETLAACCRAKSSSTIIATAPTKWRSSSICRRNSAIRCRPSTTQSKATRSPISLRRKAFVRRCGPTGGASRWKPMTAVNENIPLVYKAGGCTIVHSDDANQIQRLNQEAAKARASGRRIGIDVSDEMAWTWLSYNPAKALGIADRTGSLKPGKMADVVLWNGNPFSAYTRPEKVWIDGALMFDANDPKRRPVSDFELGQPGEGDVK
jgi:imidazolonepropionase-like amidohydrolase